MKRILAGLIVGGLAIIGIATGAPAQDRGTDGLILGAGGGAILGQAIGRDTQGTLIGTAIGGALGYIIGNEIDKQEPVQHTVRVSPDWNRPDYGHHAYPPRNNRHQQCRQTKIRARVDGRPQVVITSACYVNGRWVLKRRPVAEVGRQVVVIDNRDRHRPRHSRWHDQGWHGHGRR